ncbi:MAG: transglycosylase SLT domain-containing protein, partial [Acidobacteriota bacterium]|nr:transglycosylase SLT domain-containing protein [Acidobacteriota bacterium]
AHPVSASPLAGKINLLYGRVLLDKRDPDSSAKALNVLQTDYKSLPQPDGDFALGLAYEALAEQQQASLSYERVYYGWPNTDLAAQSSTAIERLRMALGRDFPSAPPRQQLDRCEKWIAAKEYVKARQEYVALAGTLTGTEKDEARAGIGATEYLGGNAPQAIHDLKALHLSRSEADAQRLYYLTEAARTAGDDTEMTDAVKELAEHYSKSVWRLKALIAAGNRYLLTNDRANYVPLFKAAADTFPADSATAYCHWKVAWEAYLNDKPDRVALLREQVEKYPDDSRAGTALYFLGRVSEFNLMFSQARSYYDKVSAQFPHYFYAVLARERTRDKIASATPDDDTNMWLSAVQWPAHRDFSATEPNAATAQRIERAHLLQAAGLPDVAEAELRFGSQTENEQPQLLALELAQSAESPFRALRIMKSFSGDYLSLPLDRAPLKFWQMLFPLLYKDELFTNAREKGLDPYDVAALIRQESEFNPGAKSPANAYGLMQLIPSTGRLMAKQTAMRTVSAGRLLNPAVSIQLGTQYLRQQLDNWDGDWFRTLAAYNAGPGRVHQWLNWSNYREPAEFVESIPFSETREYVQAVMRNADIYRQIYSGKNASGTNRPAKLVPQLTLAGLVSPAPAHSQARPAKVLVATTRPAVAKRKSRKAAPAHRSTASRAASGKKRNPA